MKENSCDRTGKAISRNPHAVGMAFLIGTILMLPALATPAQAFDLAGFKSRAESAAAEVSTKSLPDSKETLGRLNELIEVGIDGAKEYATRQPKYAKLMEAAIADAPSMKTMTDAEIEDKWGEKGIAGDSLGIPLKSLSQFGEERAYLELIVGPAHTYIFVKKWESTKKTRWLEQAKDELNELLEHTKMVK